MIRFDTESLPERLSNEVIRRLYESSNLSIEEVSAKFKESATYEALMDPESEFDTKSVEELMYLLELEENQDIKVWQRQACWPYRRSKNRVQLLLNDEQAQIVARACELYARLKMGQIDRLIWECLYPNENVDDTVQRKEKAEELLFEARKYLMPELHGYGHSYGVGKFKQADLAFDVYQAIRPLFGDDRKPFSYYELPECKRVEGKKK